MSDEIKALRAELTALAAGMKSLHLKLAQGLVAGKTQEEAYRIAGGKGKDPYRCACELIALNPNISEYKNLVQKIAALESLPDQIATFEQKRVMLWDMALLSRNAVLCATENEGEALNHNAVKAAQACIAELNKMDGDLAATKTESKTTLVEALTDDDLDARIAEKQRKLAGL